MSMPTHAEMKKEISDAVANEIASNGLELTTETMYYALLGVKEAWEEDTNESYEKKMYMFALDMLIAHHQNEMLIASLLNK